MQKGRFAVLQKCALDYRHAHVASGDLPESHEPKFSSSESLTFLEKQGERATPHAFPHRDDRMPNSDPGKNFTPSSSVFYTACAVLAPLHERPSGRTTKERDAAEPANMR